MGSIKLSVIIPIYNVEAYLKQCMDSVVNQTLKEIEIICINDGSTDNSLLILQKYAQYDKRIIIIDKKNEGQGVARNIALSIAKGEYIGFVDADDWIENDMFEKMLDSAHQHTSDVILCEYKLYNSTTKRITRPKSISLPINSKYLNKAFNCSDIKSTLFVIHSGPCDKIYRTDYVKRIKATFAEHLFYEDILFVYDCLVNAPKITMIKEPFYIYRIFREGSASSAKDLRRMNILDILTMLELKLKNSVNWPLICQEFELYKRGQLLYQLGQIDKKYKKMFWNKINLYLNDSFNEDSFSNRMNFYFYLLKHNLLKVLHKVSFWILGERIYNFMSFYRWLQSKVIL